MTLGRTEGSVCHAFEHHPAGRQLGFESIWPFPCYPSGRWWDSPWVPWHRDIKGVESYPEEGMRWRVLLMNMPPPPCQTTSQTLLSKGSEMLFPSLDDLNQQVWAMLQKHECSLKFIRQAMRLAHVRALCSVVRVSRSWGQMLWLQEKALFSKLSTKYNPILYELQYNGIP